MRLCVIPLLVAAALTGIAATPAPNRAGFWLCESPSHSVEISSKGVITFRAYPAAGESLSITAGDTALIFPSPGRDETPSGTLGPRWIVRNVVQKRGSV